MSINAYEPSFMGISGYITKGENTMKEITNGIIIAKLIRTEEEINLMKELGVVETESIRLCNLKAIRTELCEILVNDCGMQDEVVNAIIEGVRLRGEKVW